MNTLFFKHKNQILKTSQVLFIIFLFSTFFTNRSFGAVCNFSTVTGMGFGDYDVFNSSDKTTTGTIAFTCDTSTAVTLALNSGGCQSGSINPRRYLCQGTIDNSFYYNLYKSASYVTGNIWGDGTGGTTPVTLTSAGTTLTIYGSLPGGQDITYGSYNSTVTVTMGF